MRATCDAKKLYENARFIERIINNLENTKIYMEMIIRGAADFYYIEEVRNNDLRSFFIRLLKKSFRSTLDTIGALIRNPLYESYRESMDSRHYRLDENGQELASFWLENKKTRSGLLCITMEHIFMSLDFFNNAVAKVKDDFKSKKNEEHIKILNTLHKQIMREVKNKSINNLAFFLALIWEDFVFKEVYFSVHHDPPLSLKVVFVIEENSVVPPNKNFGYWVSWKQAKYKERSALLIDEDWVQRFIRSFKGDYFGKNVVIRDVVNLIFRKIALEVLIQYIKRKGLQNFILHRFRYQIPKRKSMKLAENSLCLNIKVYKDGFSKGPLSKGKMLSGILANMLKKLIYSKDMLLNQINSSERIVFEARVNHRNNILSYLKCFYVGKNNKKIMLLHVSISENVPNGWLVKINFPELDKLIEKSDIILAEENVIRLLDFLGLSKDSFRFIKLASRLSFLMCA